MFRTKLQETFVIIDAIFYDKATTGQSNSRWGNVQNNLQVTVGDEYTTLTPTIDSNMNRYEVPSNSIPSEPLVVEFKKHNTANDGQYIMLGSRVVNLYSSWNGNLKDAEHIKFTINNGAISVTHDGITESSTLSYTSMTAMQFRLISLSAGALKYSDFKIYSI